ncbi:MAG: pirin family protein, partial [Acidimicrobiaceae bacterium]|nr:pirin family protein [Acidimicrobiaceae bacterium]
GLFHGIQLWVNLPAKDKMIDPRYQDIRANRVTLLSSPDGGALVRVIAGEVAGQSGPGQTHTPITMLHVTVSPGGQITLPWDPTFNALAYVLAGEGRMGTDGPTARTGQLATFGPGDRITISAAPTQESRTPGLEVLLLGGRPIGEPVAHYGPFVMNTRDELAQAFDDFRSGRMGHIPAGA